MCSRVEGLGLEQIRDPHSSQIKPHAWSLRAISSLLMPRTLLQEHPHRVHRSDLACNFAKRTETSTASCKTKQNLPSLNSSADQVSEEFGRWGSRKQAQRERLPFREIWKLHKSSQLHKHPPLLLQGLIEISMIFKSLHAPSTCKHPLPSMSPLKLSRRRNSDKASMATCLGIMLLERSA